MASSSGKKARRSQMFEDMGVVSSTAPPKNMQRIPKLVPQSYVQQDFIDAINSKDIVFALGSAGSGKTYVSTHYAAEQLYYKKIDRIILTRPAKEAGGEELGFLPGELIDGKLMPYLIPYMETLNTLLGKSFVEYCLKVGSIEPVPLAYMRGRSFPNCLPGDHLVMLSDGTSIRIDQIVSRFQDDEQFKVLSMNLTENKIQEKSVMAVVTHENSYKKLIKITLEDGTVIQATPDHKLYTNRGYVAVNELCPNDVLWALANNIADVRKAQIAKIEVIDSDALVYDIEVEDNHNFFTNGNVLSSNCLIIADEMQSATPVQLKMLLTRIGDNSRMIINGDVEQRDDETTMGLEDAIGRLHHLDEVGVIKFSDDDCVRSGICKKVLKAYR